MVDRRTMHVKNAMEVSLMKNAEKIGGLIETTDDNEMQAVQENNVCRSDAKPTQLGCLKPKHHLEWTLSEVQKLVDGVAHFGVGKWPEMRRLSFASYSYCT
ncbi:hypothetical protein ACQ4PT_033862 [Festuca glaucescens]